MKAAEAQTQASRVADLVKRMVVRDQYVILAHDFDLAVTKKRGREPAEGGVPAVEPIACDSVDCIEREAVRVLAENSEQVVIHRLAAHMLLSTFASAEYLYYMSLPAAKAAMESAPAGTDVRQRLIERWVESRGRPPRDAAVLAANLIVLNFAYAEPWYLEYVIPGAMLERRRKRLPLYLGATYQSLTLIGNIPFYTADESALPEAKARALVEVAIEARRRAVHMILDVGVSRIRDLYDNLEVWLSNAVSSRSDLPGEARAMVAAGALVEAMVVPYYLAYYGFIDLNFRRLRSFDLKW